MKQMRRVAALLMCLVLIVGLVPAAVFAETQDVTYVLAGSDFQNTNNNHTAGAAYVTKLINQIKNAGYDSHISIEFEGQEECCGATEMCLKTARYIWDRV